MSSAADGRDLASEVASQLRRDVHLSSHVYCEMAKYEERLAQRAASGVPSVALCGPGKSGKDTAMEFLCQYGPWDPGLSTSRVAIPFVEAVEGVSGESAHARRAEDREYWYQMCCAIRQSNPALLAIMALASGDMINGLRDSYELYAIREHRVVDLLVWIDRPGLPEDPTMKFGPDDCDLSIRNSGSLMEFYRKLSTFMRSVGPQPEANRSTNAGENENEGVDESVPGEVEGATGEDE